ncbi:MAG: hypothetical protein IH956_07830, partial [Chloroflexi bacterium]|nr:hypothetical protein [Chloroflexota bacterium]
MKSERGFALVLVLILLGVGGLIIGPSLSLAVSGLKSRDVFNEDLVNDYAVESIVEYGAWRLNWEPGYAASLEIGVESDPFQRTINNVTATAIVFPDVPVSQLSGQQIAPPAIDQVFFIVTTTVTPTTAAVGVQTEYTYTLTIQCIDSRGCDSAGSDLEKIEDELPRRGTTSGDWIEYVPGSVSWSQSEWGIAPFEPTLETKDKDDNVKRRQKLKWEFTPDIAFAYGDVKTLTFRAEANLTTARVQCSLPKVSPVDASWKPSYQAIITVGDPSPENSFCPGDALEVVKTADPAVIPSDVLTTITYTITIENNGYWFKALDKVVDWLPSTGNAAQSKAFIYVDNSATATTTGIRTPVLFHDSFNRPNSNTVDYWTDGDGNGTDCQIDTNYVQLRLGCGITQSAISTVGHTNIFLTYRYRGNLAGEVDDILTVEWKPSSTSTWTTLASHPLDSNLYQDASHSLPASAENTTIDLRFTSTTDVSDEEARVEDVHVSAPPVSIAFDGFESGDGTGGTGAWTGNWTLSGSYSFGTAAPYQGADHLKLVNGDAYAERVVDLTGFSNP